MTTTDFTQKLPKDAIYVLVASLYLVGCVAMAIWLLGAGPQLVPHQDTRITNIIISVLAKIALGLALWIVGIRLRTQWVSILVSRQHVKLRGLLAACGAGGSLSRLRHIQFAPTFGVGTTAAIGAAITLFMTFTSGSVKYIVQPGVALKEFPGPDFERICDYSLVNGTTGYFCSGSANAVTVDTEWNNLDLVTSGAGGNIILSPGNAGVMSANVTLTSAPANLRVPNGKTPPWAAIDVQCRPADLRLEFTGNGSTSETIVYLDGTAKDQLSISEMPTWSSQVGLYHQVNDSGPASTLSPWYMVLLARDLNDGTSNIQGLSGKAVAYLGNTFVDLHGYGPVVQGILGAAAYCSFTGSTGGDWPSNPWPSQNTTNVIVGTQPANGTTDLSTIFLNYGPLWQYNPVSTNSLPGGSVSYIANWTVDADNFPDYIAKYMRNQWALMIYSNNFIGGFIANTTYAVESSPELYIQATYIVILPIAALILGVYCACASVYTISIHRFEYARVDIAPWWLLEVVATTLPGLGTRYATHREVETWSNKIECVYPFEGGGVAEGHNGSARGQILRLSVTDEESAVSSAM
ncbi:hypothetical protein BD410DRAFT_795379 [Rickenella mellea]|uniref:Uncharacterized protein n=1 Tax=Rickenella mellea TaxID=50990 RepID=A0A4Y7PLZ4_9AGAM|nr:hypothetical protein BD410DRAFT_795379 [Rickenella mellea]